MPPLALLLLAAHVEVATAGIYSAILATLNPVGKVVVIESDAIEMSRIFREASPAWSAQFDEWPAELLAVLDGTSPAPPAGALSQADVPEGARLMARSRIEDIFRADPMTGWSRFRQLTGAPAWQRFSKPILTPDGLHALVYVEHYCGIVCGLGEYVWLTWSHHQAEWQVKARVVSWVS